MAAFERDLEVNLLRLQRELAEHSYRPGGYYSFHIRDPKHRLVSAAPFRDRVVHHALCNVTEPLFERTFIGDSYANRLGKGTHRALDRAQQFARCFLYVLQCDVREFSPSIDHACLRAVLARKITDPDVLWLIDAILDNGADVLRDEYRMVYFPGDDLLEAVERHEAWVLLGEPGSGKTTTLHRLLIDSARARLRRGEGRLPLLLSLADYRDYASPHAFVAAVLRQRVGTDDLAARLRAKGLFLLVDALNDQGPVAARGGYPGGGR